MKSLNIFPIDKTNPLINTYKKAISNWDEEGSFMESLDTTDESRVYAIYFDSYFLAASNITLNPETRVACIYTVNGSNNNREAVDNYMINELPKIAESDFGAVHYMFNHIKRKKLVNRKKSI